MTDLLPPQLVIDSQMLYFGWVPKDPQAVDCLIPAELKPFDDRRVLSISMSSIAKSKARTLGPIRSPISARTLQVSTSATMCPHAGGPITGVQVNR